MSRFELDVEGGMAIAAYKLEGGVMTFIHTETPAAAQGRGAASALIRDALETARGRGLRVRATCEFVAAYLMRHPEFADLTV